MSPLPQLPLDRTTSPGLRNVYCLLFIVKADDEGATQCFIIETGVTSDPANNISSCGGSLHLSTESWGTEALVLILPV